jgi:hypothetical protein
MLRLKQQLLTKTEPGKGKINAESRYPFRWQHLVDRQIPQVFVALVLVFYTRILDTSYSAGRTFKSGPGVNFSKFF